MGCFRDVTRICFCACVHGPHVNHTWDGRTDGQAAFSHAMLISLVLIMNIVLIVPVLKNLAMVVVDAGVQFSFVMCIYMLVSYTFTAYSFNVFGVHEYSSEAAGCETLLQCTLMAIYAGLSHKGRETTLYEWVTGYTDDDLGSERMFADLCKLPPAHTGSRSLSHEHEPRGSFVSLTISVCRVPPLALPLPLLCPSPRFACVGGRRR